MERGVYDLFCGLPPEGDQDGSASLNLLIF